MPSLQFGLSSYQRAEGDLPALPVINMYAEEAPTEERGIMLQSRPGLADRSANMGVGPVRQLFQRDGVVSGALLGVSAGSLYNGTTYVGSIAGTGHVSITGNEVGAMVAAGAAPYYYNGTTLSAVSFPDSANVIKVLEGASRFIALRGDSGKFYWTPVLGTTFGALDFATAESAADVVLDALFVDDILILFGKETVEFWPNTGDAQLPFQPLEGRVLERGIKATGCATEYGSTFAWVTNLNQVCLQNENNIISNPGLEARIQASTSCRLFSFFIGGIEFLALRLDSETQVWTQRTGLWSEFASNGQSNWVAQCHANGVFGSAVDGKTLAFGSGYTDLGGVLERRFRAGFALNSGTVAINNVQLRTNIGQTPFLTGDYVNPIVEMRVSRDAAQTFGNWLQTNLGEQGQYRTRPQWRAIGSANYPGFVAEFRVSDPVPFRVSDALINEQYGGR